MRETTEMWIQERETDRGKRERKGREREEDVEYLEERLFVPFARV